MKVRMKTLDLEKTPIELTVYNRCKAVFDKNGIGEVPDRIGVILLKNNPAWYEKVEDAEAPFVSEQKPESKPDLKKKREPKADSGDVEKKQEFLATIK